MTSNINPNNIDGAYPVAGQDNDSQGFRDNFTNIKTNFTYAASEITDIQNKAVFKTALSGSTLNNNMDNNILSNVQFIEVSYPKEVLGTTATATLDFAASSYYTLTTSGTTSISFTNWPAAGQTASIRVQVTAASGTALSLPAAVSVGTSNLQGYASNTLSFNRTSVYEYEFETSDGGATISIFDLNQNRDPMYLPSSEDLANAAAVDLTKTTSYFTTTGAETATMAAGTKGQIKTLIMAGYAGNMVITVTNKGWTGTGTITFSAVGQACTLQYINSKWYCVGNNGCAFA